MRRIEMPHFSIDDTGLTNKWHITPRRYPNAGSMTVGVNSYVYDRWCNLTGIRPESVACYAVGNFIFNMSRKKDS
ncbi:hypothetical protein LCGC14_1685230 [marine sediment metagenome]|uniref:Uncharacterized protein n=1 Tax=marine sediment metagenome TaxID=412755 RepID=A0A0F9K300_9ZZZZ